MIVHNLLLESFENAKIIELANKIEKVVFGNNFANASSLFSNDPDKEETDSVKYTFETEYEPLNVYVKYFLHYQSPFKRYGAFDVRDNEQYIELNIYIQPQEISSQTPSEKLQAHTFGVITHELTHWLQYNKIKIHRDKFIHNVERNDEFRKYANDYGLYYQHLRTLKGNPEERDKFEDDFEEYLNSVKDREEQYEKQYPNKNDLSHLLQILDYIIYYKRYRGARVTQERYSATYFLYMVSMKEMSAHVTGVYNAALKFGDLSFITDLKKELDDSYMHISNLLERCKSSRTYYQKIKNIVYDLQSRMILPTGEQPTIMPKNVDSIRSYVNKRYKKASNMLKKAYNLAKQKTNQ